MFKNIKSYQRYGILMLLISTLFCGDPIPVEEMGNARYEIMRAESVHAERYASEKYEASKTALLNAHDLITEKKLSEAKEKAVEAQALATEAYNTSVPLLAAETKDEAVKILGDAEKAYAEEFAKTEYENSIAALTEGDSKMGAQDFYNAYLSYETAREEATKAKNMAEAQASVLMKDIEAARAMLDEAIQYGANESSPDAINNAGNLLNSATEEVNSMLLKNAFKDLQSAKENIVQATDIAKGNWASKKKIEATGAVESAETELVNLKARLESDKALKSQLSKSEEAQNSLKNVEETLTAAQESLGKAGEYLDKKEYQESYANSEEAIRLATIVKDQIPQLLVVLTNVASSHAEAVTPPPAAATTEEEVAPVGEGWKKYTVRLIPERRDCLWRIAGYDYVYNNPRLWTTIYKANKSIIKNPDLIYPGQIFDIPPKGGDINSKPVKSGAAIPQMKDEKEVIDQESNTTNSIPDNN